MIKDNYILQKINTFNFERQTSDGNVLVLGFSPCKT